MQTLLELLPQMPLLGAREALRYHNGYRTWTISYQQLYNRIGHFARYLEQHGFCKGDRVLLWGENRPEWLYVFWACLARGVEVVPLDYRFSQQLAARIQHEVGARLLIAGEEVDASALDIEQLSFPAVDELTTGQTPKSAAFPLASVSPDDVVEIVYTSGTTGDPKGVVHRHRNVAANLTAIEGEIARYLWIARPFQPLRLIDLLPLSHLFGQSTGLFVPVMLGGAVVFTSDFSPGALIETARRERVSVLIGVPRMLASLRLEIEHKLDKPVRAPRWRGWTGAVESWLRYRKVHARFGWKFWALIVGGAALNSDLEDFWRRLGFVVVQGYGLTEASPVIALNHPFHTTRGSIGAALAGQQIKLAPDGEILVRGPSVVHEYFQKSRAGGAASPATQQAAVGAPAREVDAAPDDDAWLHTGDIAQMDAEGRLFYRGRKKEMIVRPDGMNVYPQDVEAALNAIQGVRESVVVGLAHNGEERIHAAILLHDREQGGPRLEAVVRQANRSLEAHQRIQSWSLWPEDDFPRTPSTMKVRRGEVAQRVAAGHTGERPRPAAGPGAVLELLAEITGRDASSLSEGQRLEEDLGLSSLDRVELMARLEAREGVELDEESFAALGTVGELQQWLRTTVVTATASSKDGSARSPSLPPSVAPRKGYRGTDETAQEGPRGPVERETHAPALLTRPRWNRSLPLRLLRAGLLDFAILPMVRELVRLKVEGLENLEEVQPPVIFAANHTSHFDTAVLYAALPRRWRRLLAPAMSQDFFLPLFEPRRFPREAFWQAAGQFLLACGLFNAYPLPQKMGGARRALRYTGELIDEGYCPLVFPEGERSSTGRMLPFKSGIGLMARRLRVPVVPVHLEGVYQVYSVHQEWPEPGRVTVRIGRALRFEPTGDYLEVARAVEEAVHALAPVGTAA